MSHLKLERWKGTLDEINLSRIFGWSLEVRLSSGCRSASQPTGHYLFRIILQSRYANWTPAPCAKPAEGSSSWKVPITVLLVLLVIASSRQQAVQASERGPVLGKVHLAKAQLAISVAPLYVMWLPNTHVALMSHLCRIEVGAMKSHLRWDKSFSYFARSKALCRSASQPCHFLFRIIIILCRVASKCSCRTYVTPMSHWSWSNENVPEMTYLR